MIVIVGATGHIGSQTAEILLSQGKKVKAIARHAEKLEALKAKGAEIAVGDSSDVEFLTQAFQGADAVLLMMPAKIDEADIYAYQNTMGEAQVAAVKNAGVKNVVFISSQGGHTEENTGIVSGLARQEKRLNELDDVNVLLLRPSMFMENFFNGIGMIKGMGIYGSSVKADVSIPMIATRDIAQVAAEKLANLDFISKSHHDLLGDRNYTYAEATKILGTAIGKPDLPFVNFTYADEKAALMQYGISESTAGAFIGMYEGVNEKGTFSQGIRNEETTTPTSLEWFAENVFKYAYGA